MVGRHGTSTIMSSLLVEIDAAPPPLCRIPEDGGYNTHQDVDFRTQNLNTVIKTITTKHLL